jgi:hypothetical protein
MEISHTDPSHVAVPFAELVAAASAWDGARGLIDDGMRGARATDPSCAGPRVGPAHAERLARWLTQVALLGDVVAGHADALRVCAASSERADADVAGRFG